MRAQRGSETQEPRGTEIPTVLGEPPWPPHFDKSRWTRTSSKALKGCQLQGPAKLAGSFLLLPMKFVDIRQCKEQIAFSVEELSSESVKIKLVLCKPPLEGLQQS